MEKLEDHMQSFRIWKSVKNTLIIMAQQEDIELQQLCRKILKKAAIEFNEKTKKPNI